MTISRYLLVLSMLAGLPLLAEPAPAVELRAALQKAPINDFLKADIGAALREIDRANEDITALESVIRNAEFFNGQYYLLQGKNWVSVVAGGIVFTVGAKFSQGRYTNLTRGTGVVLMVGGAMVSLLAVEEYSLNSHVFAISKAGVEKLRFTIEERRDLITTKRAYVARAQALMGANE